MDGKNSSMKFRHELKHYINMSDYMVIRQRLGLIAKPDKHAGPDGKYRIRSLYFETPEDKALIEKLYGVNNREKFRLRYYNEDTEFIKLEKKTKVNGLGSKLSAPVTKKQCELILTGDVEWMKESSFPLMVELYAKMKFQLLRPKTVVDYMREPFVYEPGNVRITIDSKIQTGIHSKDFFNQNLPVIRTNAENLILMEVKFDEFLPTIIKDIIQIRNRKATAFSKYAVSRMYG